MKSQQEQALKFLTRSETKIFLELLDKPEVHAADIAALLHGQAYNASNLVSVHLYNMRRKFAAHKLPYSIKRVSIGKYKLIHK